MINDEPFVGFPAHSLEFFKVTTSRRWWHRIWPFSRRPVTITYHFRSVPQANPDDPILLHLDAMRGMR